MTFIINILTTKNMSTKGFAIDTKVLCYDGSVKLVQELKLGDELMGDDNTPRTITEISCDKSKMYEIIPKRGTPYVIAKNHSLILVNKGLRKPTKNNPEYVKGYVLNIEAEEYVQKTKSWKTNFHCFRSSGIDCWKDNNITLEPYFLGVWLGDGTSRDPTITNIDIEVLDYCRNYAERLGLEFKKRSAKYLYSFNHCKDDTNYIRYQLKILNLFNNKHIPTNYMISSKKSRLELLAGLIDTDGSYDKKTCIGFDMIQKNKRLAEEIVFVARSLGLCASITPCQKSCMYKGEKRVGTYYRSFISGNGIEEIPTKIPRKQAKNVNKVKSCTTSGFTIASIDLTDCYYFKLTGNGNFLTSCFDVVTTDTNETTKKYDKNPV